jgi:Tol biopolymer transport system component
VKRLPALAAAVLFVGAFASMPASATFTGANGRLAFSGISSNGERYIGTVRPDGSHWKVLTHTPRREEWDPSWSSDGSTIVFVTQNERGTEPKVRTMDADGSPLRMIPTDIPGLISIARPTWSPDGSQIAFSALVMPFSTLREQVYVMDADGANLTNLSGNTHDDRQPEWSPDGTMLALVELLSPARIVTMNADGTGRTVLAAVGTGVDGWPTWSPDGTEIAFQHSSPGQASDVYVMDADGTGVTQLTSTSDVKERTPVFSPDGTLVVFVRSRIGAAATKANLWTVPAGGGAKTLVRNTPRQGEHVPSWQPT